MAFLNAYVETIGFITREGSGEWLVRLELEKLDKLPYALQSSKACWQYLAHIIYGIRSDVAKSNRRLFGHLNALFNQGLNLTLTDNFQGTYQRKGEGEVAFIADVGKAYDKRIEAKRQESANRPDESGAARTVQMVSIGK